MSDGPPFRGQTNPASQALVAIDLGAESCRVSLLRWDGDRPNIQLLHRVANGPVSIGKSLHWPLEKILRGIEEGLQKAAVAAPEGIRSIAVDGWAVDYVRLTSDGKPLKAPYCYRDERTIASKSSADALVSAETFFSHTGAQPLRINTVYQLFADKTSGISASTPWLLLPEYVLYSLGGRPVAEYTNATHTGLVENDTGQWSSTIFEKLGLALDAAPEIVCPGTIIGKVNGHLSRLPAFADTDLIVPACHDTASAIAAISADHEDTAYIVSGTWSLVGTEIDKPITSLEAQQAGFTNQGAAAGGYCFHTNVNGMWMIKQCLDHWDAQGRSIDLPALIGKAGKLESPPALLNVDAPELMLAGEMPSRINRELVAHGNAPIPDIAGNEAIFARLIFSSLASRYAVVVKNLQEFTGRNFRQITILGGGSRNTLLTRLTEEATGLPVICGEAEGSTLGNFAVQLAVSDPEHSPGHPPSPKLIRKWAEFLTQKPVAVP